MNELKESRIQMTVAEPIKTNMESRLKFVVRARGIDEQDPHTHQVPLCTRWLKQFARPRKAVNHKVSSATYKVAVEKWAGEYVTNDAFIAAARAEGYTAVPNPHSPNFFYFNFSLPRKGTAEHTAAGLR